MKTVSQLLQGKGSSVWSVTPDSSVYDALKLMAEKNVGALVVMSDGKLRGILSERDYARGQHNLAPFSFFNGVSAEPMVVMFCPVNKRDGSENDSLANAKPLAEGGTGCFSISIATEANIAAVVKCAAELAHGESEFAYAGLTPRACARMPRRKPRAMR